MVTRETLDRMQCAAPGCDHTAHDSEMYFHARCHPAAGIEASYNRDLGSLRLACTACGKTVVEVAVARKGNRPC